ncbi:hypothetical protein QTP88_020246 [Uroleucon formosanum]
MDHPTVINWAPELATVILSVRSAVAGRCFMNRRAYATGPTHASTTSCAAKVPAAVDDVPVITAISGTSNQALDGGDNACPPLVRNHLLHLGLVELVSSLKRTTVWYFRKNTDNAKSYRAFLHSIEPELKAKLCEWVLSHPIKYNNTSENRAFKSSARESYLHSDVEGVVDRDFTALLAKEDSYAGKNSGFALSCVDGMLLGVYEYTLMGGSSYLALPQGIVDRKAVIYPQNIDLQCFNFDDQPLRYKLHGEVAVARHRLVCGTNKPILPILPPEGSTLEFNAFCKTQRLPFVMYADFEALLVKSTQRHGVNTEALHTHQPMSYGFMFVAADGDVRAHGMNTVCDLCAKTFTDGNCKVAHHDHLSGLFSPTEMPLATRKGVYPYEYTDSWSKLSEMRLPARDEFYSALTETHVDKDDYVQAELVWNHFDCHTLGDYSDLYLKIDVLLSADSFENFRDICMSTYQPDPAYYYMAPGYSFDAMLKYTRGGLTQVSKRDAKATNPNTLGYKADEPNTSLSMSQNIPYGGFSWYAGNPDVALAQLEFIEEADDVGRVYEVDISYPQSLHDEHNDMPFLPHASIPRGSKVRKFMVTFERKENYVTHYMNLKQAIANGLIVEKDYERILVNCSQQLILNRSTSDLSSLHLTAVAGKELSSESVKAMVKKVKYPNLPQMSKHSWMVKTCSQVERPRCLIIAFLTNASGTVANGYNVDYDACSLINVKAYINSVECPYEDFNESFDKNLFTMFYQNYVDFQKHYYERFNAQPCLMREQ